MKIALFCFEAKRDAKGKLRFRFALCVAIMQSVASEGLLALV